MQNSNRQHKESRTSVPNILPGQLRLMASRVSFLIVSLVAFSRFPVFWRRDFPSSDFLALQFSVVHVSGVAISSLSRFWRLDFQFFCF